MSVPKQTSKVKHEIEQRIARAARASDLAFNEHQLAHRDMVVAGAGFASWDDYLASEHHQRNTEFVLWRDRRVCRLCNQRLAKDAVYLSPTHATLFSRPRRNRASPIARRLERVVAACHQCAYNVNHPAKVAVAEERRLGAGTGNPTVAAPRVRVRR